MLNARVVSQLVCTRHAVVIALLVPGFVLAPQTVRADPIISVLPSSSNIIAGSVFSLDFVLGATDPGAADDVDDLFAYQFGITFNPFLFSANSVSEGSLLSSAGSTLFVPGTIDNAAGLIAFNANSLVGAVSGVSGAGSLLSVEFTAIGAGTGVVSPVFNVSNGDGLFDSALFFIGFTTRGGEVTVGAASVPEPSTLLLLSAGLMVLAGAQRRRPA